MIRIAITAEAFNAIAATLPAGSVGFERQPTAKGERPRSGSKPHVLNSAANVRPTRRIKRMTWSLAFTGLSALIWLSAAMIPFNRRPWLQMGVGGGRPSPELNMVLDRLAHQSWLNAAAAVCMFIAAWFQLRQL